MTTIWPLVVGFAVTLTLAIALRRTAANRPGAKFVSFLAWTAAGLLVFLGYQFVSPFALIAGTCLFGASLSRGLQSILPMTASIFLPLTFVGACTFLLMNLDSPFSAHRDHDLQPLEVAINERVKVLAREEFRLVCWAANRADLEPQLAGELAPQSDLVLGVIPQPHAAGNDPELAALLQLSYAQERLPFIDMWPDARNDEARDQTEDRLLRTLSPRPYFLICLLSMSRDRLEPRAIEELDAKLKERRDHYNFCALILTSGALKEGPDEEAAEAESTPADETVENPLEKEFADLLKRHRVNVVLSPDTEAGGELVPFAAVDLPLAATYGYRSKEGLWQLYCNPQELRLIRIAVSATVATNAMTKGWQVLKRWLLRGQKSWLECLALILGLSCLASMLALIIPRPAGDTRLKGEAAATT